MEFITSNLVEIVAIIGSVITLAGLVTALTPTPEDDKVVAKIRKVFDIIALNFGHAKNKK